MNLFSLSSPTIPIKINSLVVETPLGDVLFNCFFNNYSLVKIKPQKVEKINPNATLTSWTFENCYIEFLQSIFIPKLPSHMQVDKCIGGIWRLKAFANHLTFNFSCCLESKLKGFPESGEGLIAQSFENETEKLTIGTEDEEYLESRISTDWFPSHFKGKIFSDAVQYLDKGIQLTLPECKQDDKIQIHFIIAWSSDSSKNISTWYAVDQSPDMILQQAGIAKLG